MVRSAPTWGRLVASCKAGLMTIALLVGGGAFLSSGARAQAGFQAGTTKTLPASEADLIKADFNGDGKADLALVGADLLICLGNGDGRFTAETLQSRRAFIVLRGA